MVEQETAVGIPAEEPSGALTVRRPMLTEQAIKAITYDLKMAERLVTEALEEGIDYGQIPGIPRPGLWDPGASKIMNAFQCYPRHKILYHEETDILITWAIEAEIIERGTGRVVGSGVGACSTREPKYKYRWVSKEDARLLGYTEPQIEQLKTKKGKRRTGEGKYYDVIEYRVENPEYGEQVNTILLMASKRAETDGAKTLPGVSSALRRLFEPERRQYKDRGKSASSTKERREEDTSEESPRWTTFWNATKNLLGEDYRNKAHKMLGVPSMNEWLAKGKSLDDAIKFISNQLAKEKGKHQKDVAGTVTEDEIVDGTSLETAMQHLYGWPPEKVWAEANYADRQNFEEAGVETAWDVFKRLRGFIESEVPPTK